MGQEASWDASRHDYASGFSAHPGNNTELCPRTPQEDPFLGMVTTTE